MGVGVDGFNMDVLIRDHGCVSLHFPPFCFSCLFWFFFSFFEICVTDFFVIFHDLKVHVFFLQLQFDLQWPKMKNGNQQQNKSHFLS